MKQSIWGVTKQVLLAAATVAFTQTTWAAITNFQATSDTTNVKYSFSYAGTPAYIRVFLDTDQSVSTGFKYNATFGANFLIENGDLYRYSGSSGAWGWTRIASSSMVKSAPNVSFTVARSTLGSPAAINLIANTSAGDETGVMTQSLSTATTTTTTLAPSTVTWTRCATEGGTCSFTGTRQVRYGVNGAYAYQTATGSISCTNGIFGDPAPGYQKFCDYSSQVVSSPTTTTVPVVTTTTVPPSTVTWTRCATEGGTCSFTGTRQVRYGANGTYAYQTATGSISCTNGIFGDPVVGVQKFCDYSSQVLSTPTTTTVPVVTTTTIPTSTTPPSGSSSQVSYSVSGALISNPERGFYHDVNCAGTQMSLSQLQGYRNNEGISLIHCYNNIGAFVNSDISSSTLSLLDSNFNVMRSAGMKTVIRFVYTMSDNGSDPTLTVLYRHLDQLAPLFSKHKDVIATVQIGLVGSWGEWANSVHYGQIQALSSQNMADRKAITEKLLSVVPADRTVQIRFPRQKVSFYGSSALSSTEAFTGTARARIGHHNDCFLTTSSDWGTYSNTSVEYPYLQEETKYVPMGGETCSYMAPRSDCPTATSEMGMFHWSYLNMDYNTNVLNAWKTQGCFDTVKAKLGYRFELRSATLPSSVRVGGSASLTLNIQNSGYASPYNSRGLELILRNTSTGAVYRVNLNSDPRRWLPGATTVNQTVTIPSSIPAGTYALLLNLPDPAASLYGNPAYSIQLANSNVWEATTGFNKLNANLVISP